MFFSTASVKTSLCFHSSDKLWKPQPNLNTSCTLLTVRFKLQVANCMLQTACCKLYVANCTLLTARCKLYVANCTFQTVCCELHVISHCKLHFANCTLQTLLFKLHFANCTLQTAPCKNNVTNRETDKVTSSLLELHVAAKNWPPPIFEIENILIVLDPTRQTSKLAYLHQKRVSFIEKDKNKGRSLWADIKKAYLHCKIQKKSKFILGICGGVWGYS